MSTQPKVRKSERLPRGALDRETVVAAALEIADRDGLSGVTMARVAEALGGSPMSLYRHLQDKQALLDAVADLAVSEIPGLAHDKRSWRVRLEEYALESRRGVLRHPVIVELILENHISGPVAAATGLGLLELFHEAGFDEESAIRSYMAFRNHIVGALAWEISRFRQGGGDFAQQVSGWLEGRNTPPDSLLWRLSQVLTDDPEAQYRFGVGRLLDGFETELRRIKRQGGQER